MAWKETARSAAVQIRRLYRCDDCGHEWRQIIESAETPNPACPACPAAEVFKPAAYVPPLVGKRTSISLAVESTYRMAETQFGFTNMRDHQKPGDTAYMPPPPMQTAEREKMTRDLVQAGVPEETSTQITDAAKNFWQGTPAGAASTMGNIENARLASAEGVKQGVDPIGMLEKARETGSMRPKYVVEASSDMKT